MAQFDVYPNPNRAVERDMPFVVELQAGFLAELPTRLVAPLVRPAAMLPLPHVNPLVPVWGENLAVLPHLLVSVPVTLLSHPVASLTEHRKELLAALAVVFNGL